jgi:hypothetical protein
MPIPIEKKNKDKKIAALSIPYLPIISDIFSLFNFGFDRQYLLRRVRLYLPGDGINIWQENA